MSQRQLILVVEDDTRLLNVYQQMLDRAGYFTRGVRSGVAALRAVNESQPDLVLLDIGLDGGLDGFKVLNRLRKRGDNTRIMIVSGLGEEANLVQGLSLGADNYLVKPVSEAHLLARVRAQLKLHRDPLDALPGRFRYGDLLIDLGQHHVVQNNRRRHLSLMERKVLARLLQTPGQVVFHDELIGLWGEKYGRDPSWFNLRPLMHCIYRLRDKLKPGDGRSLIQVMRDAGFFILVPDETLAELVSLEEEE